MKKNTPFTLIYQDDRIVAVNKAAGVAVTPDRWDPAQDRLDRLVEAVLAAGSSRLWMLHRIDRDTSGLVVFAKDGETHRRLSAAFEDRRVGKRYIAVVHGRPGWEDAACDLPLIPNGNKKHQTIVDKYRGKKSLTKFRYLGGAGNYSVLEARPETGRTHQIRVHLASLGHPVVCDPLYGSGKPVFLSSFKPLWRGDPLDERPLLDRLGLHAAELVLPGPEGKAEDGDCGKEGAALRLCAPLAKDMAALINQMEKRGGKFRMDPEQPGPSEPCGLLLSETAPAGPPADDSGTAESDQRGNPARDG
ncbi:MAG: RNA pseudouridine synthase [Treponema sp.]|jgi:RluA family pseudouridine synthase|nr:RNA pseudouridine synthase [Treponema sp.]